MPYKSPRLFAPLAALASVCHWSRTAKLLSLRWWYHVLISKMGAAWQPIVARNLVNSLSLPSTEALFMSTLLPRCACGHLVHVIVYLLHVDLHLCLTFSCYTDSCTSTCSHAYIVYSNTDSFFAILVHVYRVFI